VDTPKQREFIHILISQKIERFRRKKDSEAKEKRSKKKRRASFPGMIFRN